MTSFKSTDCSQKLLLAEHAGAAESGIGTHLDHLRDAANVIIVPMRGHNQYDNARRIEAERPQVRQGCWRIGAAARVHQDPGSVADVQIDGMCLLL